MRMNIEREARDMLNIIDDKDYFQSLPEHRKTVAVSLAAVSLNAQNLEYVPEAVISKEFEGRHICRTALKADDADFRILPHIPFLDVQKEGVEQFLKTESPFLVYSFADIQDAKMAHQAVQTCAYCIQLVPDKLLTKELCKTALTSPNADEKMAKFVMERFPELKKECMKSEDAKKQQNTGMKIKM